MTYKISVIIACIITVFSCNEKTNKTTLAIGSCSHEFDSVQMWDNIITHKPKAWIWMGDNIYGDSRDMSILKAKYEKQKRRPSYQKLINSMDIYGIWDDHDYGVNDGGKEYPMKDESKLLMLDFLDIPPEAEVRNHKGAYQSYIIEDQGLKTKLILLDTRYFRDTLRINLNAPPLYHPNMEGSILGETQWSWLEQELAHSDADIHLIVSSIQLIPNEHGYEKWGNFPNERKRFFDLISKTKPARPIILSGDRHISEFSKIELEGLGYPIYEFTSSGLTHSWGSVRNEENRHRLGEMIIEKNFGIIQVEHHKKSIKIDLIVYGSENKILSKIIAQF